MRRLSQRGSATVELLVLTPVLFGFFVLALIFGRVAHAREVVAEAARAGAATAVVLPNPAAGSYGAIVAAADNVANGSHTCSNLLVLTNTSNFVNGGGVTVAVRCTVHLSDLVFWGLPGTTTVTAVASAPVDPYRMAP